MNGRAMPRATYRLQFSRNFTFVQAMAAVPYLHALGISHVYASPCLKARAGSPHGYDIVDHHALNPDIGNREEFKRFVDTLHEHGMGLILDVVPNHMGIDGGENAWWLDVLENGQASPYAAYFDIDWHPLKEALRGKVLLPLLGDHYGKVLESAGLTLEFDGQRGEFRIQCCCESRFPVDPETYAIVLGHDIDRLAALAREESHTMMEWHALVAAFEQLRGARAAPLERSRAAAACKQRLAAIHGQSAAVRNFVRDQLALFNGVAGRPETFDLLHRLLEQQSFRLAYWRVASDEINYRRFFDINELACVRQEDPEVFDATHGLVLALIADGSVDGLRVDHPDGLYDPSAYFRRIQEAAGRIADGEPANGTPRPNPPLYLVVEKILAGAEYLREDWAVSGTTGYDFANLVNGLFVYPPAERELSRTYARFTGRQSEFDEVLYSCKRQIIGSQLSSELAMLVNRLDAIAQMDRRTRDYTLHGLRQALTEVVACFPVYRTYISADGVREEDRRYILWATAQAKKRIHAAADVTVLDFLCDVLLLRTLAGNGEDYRARVLQFAMRFQQYTAPVMAKALEDTAFYAYNRLLALNEVGGDPRRFGVTTEAFHYANQQRLRRWPQAMIDTATHDSKRGEDLRTRLDAISEVAPEWRLRVSRWRRSNRGKKRLVDDQRAPSGNDEYLLYQTLLAAWPLGMSDGPELAPFRERIEAYMSKAIKEAKSHTSWLNPNPPYEAAMSAFVGDLLNPSASKAFWSDFLPFQQRLARCGLYSSLSQTLLKLTAPGVPDIYQGAELWSFTLVDPDNRRPVDFAERGRRLGALQGGDRSADLLSELLQRLEDGRAKLYLIWKALALRQRYPEVFARGQYLPLAPVGDKAEHLCAYARRRESITVVVIVARWFARLLPTADDLPLGTALWGDTGVPLPEGAGNAAFRDLLSGTRITAVRQQGRDLLAVGDVLSKLPVALLIDEEAWPGQVNGATP